MNNTIDLIAFLKELINAKQEYTKAHSDFYAAQLGYQIQLSKLLELTGE